MREIKFRAWDNLKKEMIAEGYHVIGESTMFGEIDQWVQEHRGKTPSLEYFNHIIETQFTGCIDKNGKEIYEGDIVKGGTDYTKYVNETYDVSVVEYANHGFWIKDESFGWEGEGLWDWNDLEVIGNIYEHPHLLNKDKNDEPSVATEVK